MTSNEYVIWLNGFVEINDGFPPNEKQWVVIKEKLDGVFNKVTPQRKPLVEVWSQALPGGFPSKELVEFKPEFKDGVLQNAGQVPVLDCAALTLAPNATYESDAENELFGNLLSDHNLLTC